MLPGGWILIFTLVPTVNISSRTQDVYWERDRETRTSEWNYRVHVIPAPVSKALKMAKLLSLLNCNYNQSVYKNTSENSEKHFQEAEVVSCSVNWTNSPNPKWFGSWRFNHSFSEWLQTAVKCDVNMLNWAIRSNVEMFVTKHLDIYLHFWSIIISSVDIMTVCT